MEKITQNLIITAALLALFSCSGKKEEQKGVVTTEIQDTIKPVATAEIAAKDPDVETIIETEDVKGVISAPQKIRIYEITNAKNEHKFITVVAEITDSAMVKIYPEKNNFASVKTRLEKQLKNTGTIETVESEENAWLYKVTSPGKTPVYNFLVFKKKAGKQYSLTGEGEAPMTSITNQILANKAYNAALSFVPAE